MNSVFEIAAALSKLASETIDSEHAASIVSANLSGLNNTETSDLWKLARSISYSLEDVQWIGEDPEVLEKSKILQCKLNAMIKNKTCTIEVPEHLKQDFNFEDFVGIKSGGENIFELRKDNSDNRIFVCLMDKHEMLSEFCSFNSLDSLEGNVKLT